MPIVRPIGGRAARVAPLLLFLLLSSSGSYYLLGDEKPERLSDFAGLVYGVVAAIVKMDDAGLALAGRSFHYKPLATTGDRESGQVVGKRRYRTCVPKKRG